MPATAQEMTSPTGRRVGVHPSAFAAKPLFVFRSFRTADVATASPSHLSLSSRSLVGRSVLPYALFALTFDCSSM